MPLHTYARTRTLPCNTLQTYAAIMAYAKEDTGPVYPTRLKPKVSRDARDFIEDLLDPDPKQRLGCRGGGFDDIECHAWFDDFTWQVCDLEVADMSQTHAPRSMVSAHPTIHAPPCQPPTTLNIRARI